MPGIWHRIDSLEPDGRGLLSGALEKAKEGRRSEERTMKLIESIEAGSKSTSLFAGSSEKSPEMSLWHGCCTILQSLLLS